MPWNETPLARSQRLRAEYLMAGARYARTRRSQRTPGAAARSMPLGGSVNKTVPRSNRSFIMTGAPATSEVTSPFGPSATTNVVKNVTVRYERRQCPKIDTRASGRRFPRTSYRRPRGPLPVSTEVGARPIACVLTVPPTSSTYRSFDIIRVRPPGVCRARARLRVSAGPRRTRRAVPRRRAPPP